MNLLNKIKNFPTWSAVFNQEKLNESDVAGIKNIIKKINDPIFPIFEDKNC